MTATAEQAILETTHQVESNVKAEEHETIVVVPLEEQQLDTTSAPVSVTVTEQSPALPRRTATTAVDETDEIPIQSRTSRDSMLKSVWKRHKMSLSRAPSTPCIARYLIPLLSLATHLIFLYGQTATMWRLHLSQQVDVWANATSFESQTTLSTLGLPYHNHILVRKEKTVKEFTYMYAIHELWKAAHMPGKVLPRSAAVLLIIFSGVWPHLKLFLLNFTWLLGSDGVRRSRMLHWLSTLGKWSLADVLVVCVMVGVLHLDWVVDPVATKAGLINDLPYVLKLIKTLYTASDVCSLAMKIDCHVHHKSWDKWSQCRACVGFVKTILEHPSKARGTLKGFFDGMDVGGGGLVYLRVHGMSGIYVFCSAVILSIVISLVVDVFDVRAQRARHVAAGEMSVENSELVLAVEDENDGDSYEDFHTQFHYRRRLHSAGEVAYDGFIRQTEELQQKR